MDVLGLPYRALPIWRVYSSALKGLDGVCELFTRSGDTGRDIYWYLFIPDSPL